MTDKQVQPEATQSQKTYKRETASLMLATTFLLMIVGIWVDGAKEVGETLLTPVFLFAGAAFGMDAYAKQVK